MAHVSRVSLPRAYINSCPATATHNLKNQSRFASRYLRRHRSLPHPERRRASANGRVGLWNHSPLRSFTGEGELGFWEALCATARVLHHGSSSIQVGRCCLPPSSSSSSSTGLLQRCHQQHYCCDFTCKRTVCAVYCYMYVHHALRVHV
jgi:hypothetical protein